MKEDGLIGCLDDYWRLPEPVAEAWRMYASERGKAMERERKNAERGR